MASPFVMSRKFDKNIDAGLNKFRYEMGLVSLLNPKPSLHKDLK